MMYNRDKQRGPSWNGRNGLVLRRALSSTRIRERRREGRRLAGELFSRRVQLTEENWELDAHWTAITRHLDGMFFPKEG